MASRNNRFSSQLSSSRLTLWAVAILVAASIVATGGLSIWPIYKIAQSNATQDAQDAIKTFNESMARRTVSAIQASEYISRSDDIKKDISLLLQKHSDDLLADLLNDLIPFFQTSQASFIALFTPEKKSVIGIGMPAPFGEDFSNWGPLKGLQCESIPSGLAAFDGKIFSLGTTCLFDNASLFAIAVVGYKVDDAFVEEISNSEKAMFHISPSDGIAVSSFTDPNFARTIAAQKNDIPAVYDAKDGRLAVATTNIIDMNNAVIGKASAAVSLASFDKSLRNAIITAGSFVFLPFTLTLVFLVLLGRRLVSLVQTSTKLQHQIATTLRTRDTLRNMRTKRSAAMLVSQQIYVEISNHEKTQPSFLFLPETMSLEPIFESDKDIKTPTSKSAIDILENEGEPAFLEGHLYAPITYHGNKLGVLVLSGLPASLDVTDLHFVSMMAGALGGTFQALNNLAETENRVRKEATLAAENAAIEVIQHQLLPNNVQIPHIEIAMHYKAAESAGGDWYGCYYDEKRKVAYFLIGDVTGHGISSAIIAGVACGASLAGERSLRRYVDSSEEHVSILMNILNEVICEVGHSERAMTMCVLAIETDSGKFYWASAAHTHPFQVEAANGKVHALVNSGPHLGYTQDGKFGVKSGTLNPNDILVFYTDGLTENSGPDGTTFYDAALKRAVAGLQNVHSIKSRVLRTYDKIVADEQPADDVSLLVVQWTGDLPPKIETSQSVSVPSFA